MARPLNETPPAETHGYGPPTRRIRRWFVIALTSFALLASCTTEAKVEIVDGANAGASEPDVTSAEPPAGQDSDDQPAVTNEIPTEPADDEAETDPQPTIPPEPTDPPEPAADPPEPAADSEEPLYELQGELPISVEEANGLIEFIQEETGRDFLRPPVIVAQSAEDFAAGLAPQTEEFLDEADDTVRYLQALGLTDQGVTEVSDAFLALLNSPNAGVQGYYDTETDELYVPVDILGDDDFRSLLVHELTHALDGQHTDLTVFDRLIDQAEEDRNFEPVAAYRAVVEGRATSVQNRWIAATGASQGDPDLDLVESVPPALVLQLSIPYGFGEQFVEANGGPGNTWDLLENPPLASEEIMVAGTAIGVEEVVDVPLPASDGPVLYETSFGAADLLVWLLGESLEPNPARIFPTLNALDGWAGGNAVLWGDETESCIRIAFAADSTTDLEEIAEATRLWADAGGDRTVVTDGDLVTVTGCAPYIE